MATYQITTTDAQEAGVTAARELYNATNPDNVLVDNNAYLQFVMTSAFKSYVENSDQST